MWPKKSEWICWGEKKGKDGEIIYVHDVPQVNTSDKCVRCGADRPKTTRDIPLLIALIILNFGSGFTTIVGVTRIFANGLIGFTSGAAIQILLFLLVSGYTARHTPRRKWLAVAALSTISIYTSFFAYYTALAGNQNQKDEFSKANAAHQKIVSEVYTPMVQRLTKLKADVSQLKNELKDEIGGNLDSREGFGKKARIIYNEIKKDESEIGELTDTVKRLHSEFYYKLEGKSPENICNTDKAALADAPKQYLTKYQKLDTLCQGYLNESTRIALITPFNKIKEGEETAIFAALFALMVDGLIILLGTSIESHDSQKVVTQE